jgi:hypothetical protein
MINAYALTSILIMQTVACIPVDDGVLEIGTTEKVSELVMHFKNYNG